MGDQKVKDCYVSHKKCGRIIVLREDRCHLYEMGIYPVRCDCGDLVIAEIQYEQQESEK